MTNVAVNGIDVYYERRGEGPRLLFLNGSGSTLASSRLLIDPFTQHFDVAAHDQRGLGKSSIPPGPYTMADYAADAAGLLDELGWDRALVAGISFGGMVAQELAVTWPVRVERLALLCTSPGGVGGSSYPLHELESLPLDERRTQGYQLLDTRYTPEYLDAHPDAKALADLLAQRELAPKTDEERRGELEQLGARRHHDVCDRLGAITAPTLVTAGRYDGIAPVANSEAIVARIPNGELRTYEGGHAFVAQDPQAFPDLIEFLGARAS
jgi:pimeloyl-ACP methyl ester carboxylesterase